MKGLLEMCINIPNDVEILLNELNKKGFESFIAGGCVRDSLLGKKPKDWDLTTNARPEQVAQVFKDYKVIETGLKHGTLTVIFNEEPYEITTYRNDGEYLDNRRPNSVSFVSDLKEDLSRRDFTINAMAYNNVIGLIDYLGGIEDLNNKLVKCVGIAENRFNEDGLRILRAIRFSSILSFDIEEKTKGAIHNQKDLLNNISKERISAEWNKIICGENSVDILYSYADVISVFIPEIVHMFGFEQNNPYHIYDVWGHTIETLRYSPKDLEVRLALFFHDIGKPESYTEEENGKGHFYSHHLNSERLTENILIRLRYDKVTIERVKNLVYFHNIEIAPVKKSVKRILNKIGKDLFDKLLVIKYCDMMAQSELSKESKKKNLEIIKLLFREIINEDSCFQLKDLSINGNDLINSGFATGKGIGIILKDSLNAVMNEEIENNKNDLLFRAKMNKSFEEFLQKGIDKSN